MCLRQEKQRRARACLWTSALKEQDRAVHDQLLIHTHHPEEGPDGGWKRDPGGGRNVGDHAPQRAAVRRKRADARIALSAEPGTCEDLTRGSKRILRAQVCFRLSSKDVRTDACEGPWNRSGN